MKRLEAEEKYQELIALARSRRIVWEPFKYEEHHILPRCMGGGDEKANLVLLRIKEHLRAHKLLAAMHPSNYEVGCAYRKMLNGTDRVLKLIETDDEREERFEKVRVSAAKKISAIHKGRVKSPEEIENIRTARFTAERRGFSDEAKVNMAEARKKTWAERKETGEDQVIAAKIVATRRANGSYVLSEERKKQISEAQKGRVPWNKGKKGEISDETRAKMSLAKKGKPSTSKGSTGKIPYNKGKKGEVSEETREKMRTARLNFLSK